ncbi:PQQ-binding-like beta-propeller repeat protein [Dyadobacter sp. NIV53]|uniref:outer membrane protein assembly factor BamB family protein n=1 Tax=Dyadobacter sp. NIV53 TaxID=2861765 RepID=UPI001C86BC70|nr:PQQ-binding-like beta-propeller repeat protein [Dyadobacter sp. NIV53]
MRTKFGLGALLIVWVAVLFYSCSKNKDKKVDPQAGAVVYAVSEYGKIYAIDAGTGIPKWVYLAKGNINSSPIVDAGTLYIADVRGRFVAIDVNNGKEKWFHNLGSGNVTSAIVANNIIYLTSRGACFALSPEDGSVLWKFETEENIYASPAVDNETVYVGNLENYLHAIDGKTGKEKWKFCTEGEIYESPVIRNGTVYVSDYNNDAGVYAFDANSGQLKWKTNIEGNYYVGQPVASDSGLYVMKGNQLLSFDLITGKQIWSAKTDPNLSFVVPIPTLVNGLVYVQGYYQQGNVYACWLRAINAETGQPIWLHESKSNKPFFFNSLNASFAPTASGDYVYFASQDGHLRSVDARTGKEIWAFNADETLNGSPCVVTAQGHVRRGLGQVDL